MQHKVVSRDEWIAARKAHLANEKAFTKARDRLSAERRALPWVKVEKNYLFDTPEGKKSLADLFDGRSQLIVYHFMLGPDWGEGCPSCSYLADHFDGAAAASRASRRDVHRRLARAARRDRSVPAAHGLALPVGVVLRQRLQLRLRRLVQARRRRQGARSTTIMTSRTSPATRCRA